jgi:hypothetical protein
MKNFFDSFKDGLTDVKNMLEEHNFKPFATPLIILFVVFFALRYVNNSASGRVLEVRNKVEAHKAEINNEQEYKNSKAVYEKLVQRLPPADGKNEWLYQVVPQIFEANKMPTPKTAAQNTEDSGIFTLASMSLEFETDYQTLGKLVESIENYEKFLRISSLLAVRQAGSLGKVKVNMIINTVFSNDEKGARGKVQGM